VQVEISYPNGIPFRVPRPRGENGIAGATVGALLSLLFTANPIGIIAGGAVGNALGNQPQPLEAAIRSYFTKKDLPVIGFYRLGPHAAKVLFSYLNQYWIVESHAPQNPNWTAEQLEDWLYGDLVQTLGSKLAGIDQRSIQ
jgi:hypothetical protein